MNQNDMLKELLKLQDRTRKDQKRIDEIKAICKKTGSFSTEDYVCAIKYQNRTSLVSLEEAASKLGMNILLQHKLIANTSYAVITVSKKEFTLEK